MTLYDRLPDLIEGCNELVRSTGVRRRIMVCPYTWCDGAPHYIARRADIMPASVMR